MDEKTVMTVEFLRARLLSERTVSRTARQRAEMLSQRVMELEEQLRIVKIQRKKAERATEEVLSILDSQGITYISGLTDSSTDKEENQCTLSEDVQEDEFLTASGMDRSEVDDGSSRSDVDGCPPDYRSLSWKSHGSSVDSQRRQKTKQIRHRQRSSFIISVKSSQTCPGKSCRKIKRPDVGSASGNELQKPALDVHGNGMIAWSKNFNEKHDLPLEASESKMETLCIDSQISSHHDGQNREYKDIRSDKDDGMERALEQQAQLIGQFRAMENAQREWEEKFNETNISILDNHESGNLVSVAENSNRPAGNSKLVNRIHLHEEEKLSVKDIPFEDTMDGRCKNCAMTHKNEVAIDKFSPGLMSSSTSSPSRNNSNGCTNGLLNQKYESATINEMETVSRAVKFPPQDNPDVINEMETFSRAVKFPSQDNPDVINEMETVSRAVKFPPQDNPDVIMREQVGPNFEKSNNGTLSNLKMNQHKQEVILHCSSKVLNAQENKKILYGLPEIQQEHPRHLSQAHGFMEQQYDTMTVNESKYASQVYKTEPQNSPGLVASGKDLQGSIYERPNISFNSSAKKKSQEQGLLHNSSTPHHVPNNDEKISERVVPELERLPRQLSHSTSSRLGSVLQSLQRAKVSIREELAKRPSTDQGTLSIIAAPANSPMKPHAFCKTSDVPVGPPGLFSLPTDSFPQPLLSGSNVYGSGLRLTATSPDLGLMTSTISAGKEYYVQSPNASSIQGRSRVSIGKDYTGRYAFKPHNEDAPRGQVRMEYLNHFPARYLEPESHVSTAKDYLERHSSSSISASSANDYPFYYQGLSTRMPSLHSELPNPSLDLRKGMPYNSRYSYDLHRL